MNVGIGTFLKDGLTKESIESALRKLAAAVVGGFQVQHKEDGTHTNVTLTTLEIADVEDDGNLTGSLIPTTATQDLGAEIEISNGASYWRPWRSLLVSDSINWHPFANAATDGMPTIVRSTRSLAVTCGADGSSGSFTATGWSGSNTCTLTVNSGVASSAGIAATTFLQAGTTIFERGRGTALGEWIDVTYAAGNFTASSGSWTVDSGDQSLYHYTLVGTTMILAWSIANTDVSAGSVLRLAIPGGFTAAATMRGLHHATDAGGAEVVATCRAVSGQAYIELYPTIGTGGTWTITAGDNTTTVGSITFEVA